MAAKSKCHTCSKNIFGLDKFSLDGNDYHKDCLKCVKCGMKLTMNNLRHDKGEILCAKHFTAPQEIEEKKRKAEEQNRRVEAKAEEERRENEGGWRDCIGALWTHYPTELYQWPLEGIEKAWNYCRNDRQKNELREEVLASLKLAQEEFADPEPDADDGSPWQEHVDSMLYRDNYGQELHEWSEKSYVPLIRNFNSRQRSDFQKWLAEKGRQVDFNIPPETAPTLHGDVAAFLKIET